MGIFRRGFGVICCLELCILILSAQICLQNVGKERGEKENGWLEILVFLFLLSDDTSHSSRERWFACMWYQQIWIPLSVLPGISILLQGKNYPASVSSSLVWSWLWSLLGVRKTWSLSGLKCCELLGLLHLQWLSCLLFGQVLPCSIGSPSEHLENCLSNRVKIINESYITCISSLWWGFFRLL